LTSNHAIVKKVVIEIGGKVMVSQKVVIKNPTGLHLRPAGILCKEAMQFKSLITFLYKDSTANAKSVLSVLGACVKCGDEIEFVCEGEDEEEALKSLVQAVESGLGE
jgi:phosphocarrier protein